MKETLENIINGIKEIGKIIVKHPVKTAVGLAMPFIASENLKANQGVLTIENNLNSEMRNVNIYRDDINFPGTSDGHDYKDGESNPQPNGFPDIYSDINTHTLWSDFRPKDSNIPYDIKLSFSGSLPSTQSNWLTFDFPYETNPFSGEGDYTFGDNPITFQSDALPYGNVVDVRRAINQNSGRVDLIDVVAGTSGVYDNSTLDINSRLLSDLNDDGIVNIVDYTMLANGWMKPQGQYVGDISGVNGIPDGVVNNYDLARFCSDWLREVGE